ncbi:MAG: 50S ribosomal protein L11 methyltransferase [Bacteroidota bacterium]
MGKNPVTEVEVSIAEDLREPVMALLADIGFSAFEETDTSLRAYVESEAFDAENLHQTLGIFDHRALTIEIRQHQSQNWNAVWESNYAPVEVDNICQIVSTFHTPKTGFDYTILINPQMSFGTGHHQTTRLMVRQMDRLDFPGKEILDMGCGTGILAILALKMGAKKALGIDIDQWSEENARENCLLNEVSDQIEVQQGDVTNIPPLHYDVILANINRNVLLADMAAYVQHLRTDAKLVLSGFYVKDLPQIEAEAARLGLETERVLTEDQWCSVCLTNS